MYKPSIMFHKNAFFFFGGWERLSGQLFNRIVRLDGETFKWSLLDQQIEERFAAQVIIVENQFLLIGGRTFGHKQETEKCFIENDQITCVSQEPLLADYMVPLLMLVQDDFCKP